MHLLHRRPGSLAYHEEAPPENRIIALVGPPGSGRRTCVNGLQPIFGHTLPVLRATTTMKATRPNDHVHYRCVEEKEFDILAASGHLLHVSEISGIRYGYDKLVLDELLSQRNVICATTPEAVMALRDADYTVYCFRIKARRYNGEPAHAKQGAEAAAIYRSFRADTTVLNNVDSSCGRECAIGQLAYYIHAITGIPLPEDYVLIR